MDRYEQFHRAATDRGIPGDEIGRFADQLRFAVWAGIAQDGDDVVGQFGGLPRLPVGVKWPSSADGSPLPFLASVDCAALPRAEGLALPETGSLLFFLHHEDDLLAPLTADEPEFARVVHVPAGTETAPADPPADHADRTFFHEDIPFLLTERPLSASVEPVLPKWVGDEDFDFDSDVLEELAGELEHAAELVEVVDELWPEPDRSAWLRLGGYCSQIGGQDTPWTRMKLAGIASRREARLPDAERLSSGDVEEYRLTREWLPLAQFYTASDYHYGCFLISSDDLEAGRFDRMRSFTMFSE
ncbi:DUF1963 domain-containing protein [Lentzea sp. NPDC058450]|uniref:DUF1963 domain-containing protein n=1 Tax=Lentzea sp. NPDC058450 TaxID=3346505 RepID=UPI003656121E